MKPNDDIRYSMDCNSVNISNHAIRKNTIEMEYIIKNGKNS